MTRVEPIYTVDDIPASFTAQDRADYEAFVQEMYDYSTSFKVRGLSAGWSQLAQSPAMATRLLMFSDQMLNKMPWSQNARLREIVIQAVCTKVRNAQMSFGHWDAALRAGISPAELWSINFADTHTRAATHLLDEEELFVVDFAHAVVDGQVSDEQVESAKNRYGTRGFVEMTVLAAYYVFWCTFTKTFDAKPSFLIDGRLPPKAGATTD